MSVPKSHGPDPHADPLIESVLRASLDETGAGCPDAEVLALYAEEELPGDERGGVEAHVAGCARCQQTVAAFVRGEPEAPVAPAAASASAVAWWTGWRWLVPLASATAVLAVAVWIGRGPSDQVADSARITEETRASDNAETPAAIPPDAPGPGPGERNSAEALGTLPAEPAVSGAASRLAEAARSGSAPGRRQDAGANARAIPVATPEAMSPAAKATGAVTPAEITAAGAQMPEAAAPASPPRADARERTEAMAASPAEVAPPALGRAAADVLAGAAVGAAAATGRAALTGTITYRSRVPLPAGAVIEVRLLDVSRADAPADTLARVEIVTRGEQVPVPFTLGYDADALQSGRRYLVQATIAVDGRVTWRTTTEHPVFAAGRATTAPITVTVDAIR